MDRNLTRLRDEQLSELRNTGTQITQWEKFKEDYNHLEKRLKDLPNKVSYDVMVPLGSLAFMPGQLVHTNEILVLLGENWFVEKSAKEACEVIRRRKQAITETIEKFEEQKKLLESRLEFTSDIQKETSGAEGIVDIREEYDPEEEAKWRENRAKRKKEAADKKMQDTGSSDGETQEKTLSTRDEDEAALWAKLDELERQEEEMDELARMDKFSDVDEASEENLEEEVQKEMKKKAVKWRDQEEGTADVGVGRLKSSQGDEKEIVGGDAKGDVPTILFSHSDVPSAPPSAPSEMLSSPADIYQRYQSKLKETSSMQEPPKSILKESSKRITSQNEDQKKEPEKEKEKPVVQSIPESAFSGNVVEHKSTGVETQSKKRVSKFKQARQVKGGR